MPDFDPEGVPAALTRGYLRALIGGVVLLAFYCLFNVLADPSGEFGLSGRFVFNRNPSKDAIARGEAGGSPMFYARAIRESGANVFLLGSSRTWRGFDTCAHPGVLRVAGSAWELSQLSQAQSLVLASQRKPVTLLMEVGLPQDERGRAGREWSGMIAAAISPRGAWSSLETVTASIRGVPRMSHYTSCAPFPSAPANWALASRNLPAFLTESSTTPHSLMRGRANLLEMADDADRACARTGIRHRLIYYSLPLTPQPPPSLLFDTRQKANAQIIADMFVRRPAVKNGCAISFRNYTLDPPGTAAERLMWQRRNNWSDYVHFQPQLGQIAFDALIRRKD